MTAVSDSWRIISLTVLTSAVAVESSGVLRHRQPVELPSAHCRLGTACRCAPSPECVAHQTPPSHSGTAAATCQRWGIINCVDEM
jgi:hypothetical protein